MLRIGIRYFGLALVMAIAVFWLGAGGDRGWTKTSLVTQKLDVITGIEYPVVENRFIPGLDFLVLGSLAGLAIFSLSFIPTKKP